MTQTPLALITGGAQGIGYACAEALKEDGFDVILADINAEGVAEAGDKLGAVAAITCDMGDVSQIEAMFARIAEDHGPLSALVNNAGVAMPGDFLSYDLESWERVIDINLRGVFLATQTAARSMVENGIEGAIVNMSSINAQVAIPAIPAYCASKGGVAGAGQAQHPRQRRGPRFDRHRDDGRGQRQPRGLQGGHVAYPAGPRRLGPRDRRRGGLPLLEKGQLHHRRDDLCRWRSPRPELHLLEAPFHVPIR